MTPLRTAFANIQWLWVLEAGFVLSCFYLFLHRGLKMNKPALLVDLCVTVFLATIGILYLVRSHATAGAKEVILAFCFAYLIDSAITFFWKSRIAGEAN